VTITALVPFTVMFAAINRKVLPVMIKCRRFPGGLCMTAFTISRKLCALVGRISCLIVIIGMTTITSVRCGVVISVMTGSTIICDCSMSARKDIIIVVDCKCCRRPVRICSMTSGTIIWNSNGIVIRICALVIRVIMTIKTYCRSSSISVFMAFNTVNCRVGAS